MENDQEKPLNSQHREQVLSSTELSSQTPASGEKRIKVYDLDAFFHAECQMEAFRYKQVVVFEGKKGIVLAEEEAVHKLVNGLDDTVEIPINKLPEPGKVWLIANYMCTISIDEILKAPSYEMHFTDFFKRRDYNPRCQSNFRTLLQSLHRIDFDISDYYQPKEPLTQQLKAAESRKKQNTKQTPTKESGHDLV